MEKIIRSLLAVAVTSIAVTSLACDYPGDADFVVPNGAKATKEEMIATQGKVKSFVSSIEGYLTCLDEKQAAAGDELTEEQQSIYSMRYNAAVDAMEQVADQFNTALGAYRDAQ
ncbi:MAG: hypothetical protein AAF465_11150 [Pseudomonadota bacterium]